MAKKKMSGKKDDSGEQLVGLKAKTKEDQRLAIEAGEEDEDLETAEGREEQIEEDEIEPWEAGFAEGASEEGQLAKDALTGEPLMDAENIVEEEIDGRVYRFISQKNAQKFLEKRAKLKKR